MASEKQRQSDSPKAAISLVGVQLKVLGNSLEVLQKYDKALELRCFSSGKSCSVSLSNGEMIYYLVCFLIRICLVIVHPTVGKGSTGVKTLQVKCMVVFNINRERRYSEFPS